MPKLNLKDVVLDKTRALNRENDTIWAATLDVVKELVTLRNSAETGMQKLEKRVLFFQKKILKYQINK